MGKTSAEVPNNISGVDTYSLPLVFAIRHTYADKTNAICWVKNCILYILIPLLCSNLLEELGAKKDD